VETLQSELTMFQQMAKHPQTQASHLHEETCWTSAFLSSSCDDDDNPTAPQQESACDLWIQNDDVKIYYENVYVCVRQKQTVILFLFLIGVEPCGETDDGCGVTYSNDETATLQIANCNSYLYCTLFKLTEGKSHSSSIVGFRYSI